MADDKKITFAEEKYPEKEIPGALDAAPEDDREARDYVKYGLDGTEENVLLSAAAGSGKTRTLVERIVEKAKKLPAGKHIDAITVVTFTRAAAAELISRIEGSLSSEIERLRKNGEQSEADKLVNELYLLPKASIGTIDSFCLEIVRKNFTSVKSCCIDPSFGIDNDIANMIRKDVAAKVLEEYYAKGRDTKEGKIIRNILAAHKSYRDDKEFIEDILTVCNFCENLPDPEAWLKKAAARFDTSGDVRKNFWYGKIKAEYDGVLCEAREHAEKTLLSIEENPENYSLLNGKDIDAWVDRFNEAIGVIDREKARLDDESNEIPALFSTKAFGRNDFSNAPSVKVKGDTTDKTNVRIRLKTELTIVKKTIKDFYDGYIAPLIMDDDPKKSEKLFKTGIKEVGEYISLVSEIAGKIYTGTIEECARKRNFSFSAVAHFALEILCEEGTLIENGSPETLVPSDVAKAYRRTIDEIYVDEYQDTSMLQEFILYQVSGISEGRNNMIMVGDIKQSIYSFRNAMPRLMLEKSRRFTEESGGVLKHLSRNFRSRKGIIDGVNEVFSKIMTESASDIDYTGGGHRLVYGAVEKYEGVPLGGDPNGGRCEIIYSPAGGLETEAAIVVSKIEDFKKNLKVYDVLRDDRGNPVLDENGKETGIARDLRYGDICILVGTNKNITEVSAFLSERAFPVDTKSTQFFFERSEIYDILNFARIIDNPRNDIPLASVLRSDYFGFTENELAEIRAFAIAGCGNKDLDYWDQLVFCGGSSSFEPAETALKAKETVKKINELRDLCENITVSSFVWKLINFNDYYKNCDETAKGNLRTFLSLSYPFDKGVFGGMYGFVKSIDKAATLDPTLKEFDRQKSYSAAEDTPDKIQIMTTHKSKGLEFPVVFLMLSNSGRERGKDRCSCDESLGIGLEFQYEDGGTFKKLANSAPNVMMARSKKEGERKEKQRVVYVALTRAKEKLVVVGSHKNREDDDAVCASIGPGPLPVASTAAIKAKTTPFGLIWFGATNSDSSWERTVLTSGEIEEIKSRYENNGGDADGYEDREVKTEAPEDGDKTPGRASEADDNDEGLKRFAEAIEIANGGSMPVKISVSSLKRFAEDDGEELEKGNVFRIEAKEFPSEFGKTTDGKGLKDVGVKKTETKKLRGAALGVLMHKIMKNLVGDRRNWPERDEQKVDEYVGRAIGTMRDEGVIDGAEELSVDRRMIGTFLMSDRAAEIKAADCVRCEIPFTYRTDLEKYLPFAGIGGSAAPQDGCSDDAYFKSTLKDRKIIALQGVIDLYYKLGTSVVVVDYKTDNVDFTANDKTIEAYLLQIRCYRDALEEISGEKVEESLLFFLRNGKEIRLSEK